MRTRVCLKRADKLHARQVVYAIRLGTFNRHHRGGQDTIAFAYKEVKMLKREKGEIPNLDVVRDRLLVPSSVTSKDSEYPAEGIAPVSMPSFQNFAREIFYLKLSYGMESENYYII